MDPSVHIAFKLQSLQKCLLPPSRTESLVCYLLRTVPTGDYSTAQLLMVWSVLGLCNQILFSGCGVGWDETLFFWFLIGQSWCSGCSSRLMFIPALLANISFIGREAFNIPMFFILQLLLGLEG